MKKVLVGVDSSEYAEKALKQTIEIAEKFSAEITVNVYHAPAGQGISDKAKENLENFKVVLSWGGWFE